MVAQQDGGGSGVVVDNNSDSTAPSKTSLQAIYFSDGHAVTASAANGNQIASIHTTTTFPASQGTPTATAVVTVTPSAAAASSSQSAASSSSHSGLPMSTLLPAVIVPVVVLLIAIPALIFYWFHRRNKKLEEEQRRRSTPDMQNPPTSAALLQHKQSQPSLSFTTPYSDGEKTYGADTLGSYEAQGDRRRSLEKEPEAIVLNARNRAWSNGRSPPRGPSPTLPSPSVTKRPERPERPKQRPTTQEAWPLPAHAILPTPPAATATKPTPTPPPANDPGMLPPVTLSEPLSWHDSLATDSSIYDLSSTAGNFPEPPQMSHRALQPGVADSVEIMNPTFYKKRESDLVSELSNPGEASRAPRSRRDTDAVSVVSAITDRSNSQRRKSTASAVSALSPDDHPLPIQNFSNFPRR